MTEFEYWWTTVREDVVENCENRLDQYDAYHWMKLAFENGQLQGSLKACSLTELVNELHRRMND